MNLEDLKIVQTDNYILDENYNVHRVNVLFKEDDDVYIIPTNQVRKLNIDEVYSDKRTIIYESLKQKLDNDINLSPTGGNVEFYDECYKQLKDEYPEKFI